VPDFDTSVPHIARIYDYWLGGKDNFAEAGIRQFLDIGTGIPTANNTHEVAQAVTRMRGSSTWTTTRSCSATHGPC
jgi:S-adenosyl methyltransferase